MKITNIIPNLPRKGTQDTPHAIGSITKIIVHHDAQWRSANYNSLDRYVQQANYHIGRGEDGLQYHYKIDNVGEVFQCRALTDTLWHAANYPVNRASIAICLDGDFTQQIPTREQYIALRDLLNWLSTEHPEFPAAKKDVFGHTEVSQSGTACPGRLIDWVRGYRNGNENIPEVVFNDGSMGPVPTPIPQTQTVPVPPPVTQEPTPFKGEEPKVEEPVVPVEEPKVEEVKEPSTPVVEVPEKEKPMLKGYRTYLALGFGAVALAAPAFGLPKEFAEPIVALCLALAAYFRAKA